MSGVTVAGVPAEDEDGVVAISMVVLRP